MAEDTKTDEVSKPVVKVVVDQPRLVKVNPLVTKRTYVVDGWYELQEGEAMLVPEYVKAELVRAGGVVREFE